MKFWLIIMPSNASVSCPSNIHLRSRLVVLSQAFYQYNFSVFIASNSLIHIFPPPLPIWQVIEPSEDSPTATSAAISGNYPEAQ